jgi:hypothetical protein
VFHLNTLGCLLVVKLCIVVVLLLRNVDSRVLLGWSVGDVNSFGLHNWYPIMLLSWHIKMCWKAIY